MKAATELQNEEQISLEEGTLSEIDHILDHRLSLVQKSIKSLRSQKKLEDSKLARLKSKAIMISSDIEQQSQYLQSLNKQVQANEAGIRQELVSAQANLGGLETLKSHIDEHILSVNKHVMSTQTQMAEVESEHSSKTDRFVVSTRTAYNAYSRWLHLWPTTNLWLQGDQEALKTIRSTSKLRGKLAESLMLRKACSDIQAFTADSFQHEADVGPLDQSPWDQLAFDICTRCDEAVSKASDIATDIEELEQIRTKLRNIAQTLDESLISDCRHSVYEGHVTCLRADSSSSNQDAALCNPSFPVDADEAESSGRPRDLVDKWLASTRLAGGDISMHWCQRVLNEKDPMAVWRLSEECLDDDFATDRCSNSANVVYCTSESRRLTRELQLYFAGNALSIITALQAGQEASVQSLDVGSVFKDWTSHLSLLRLATSVLELSQPSTTEEIRDRLVTAATEVANNCAIAADVHQSKSTSTLLDRQLANESDSRDRSAAASGQISKERIDRQTKLLLRDQSHKMIKLFDPNPSAVSDRDFFRLEQDEWGRTDGGERVVLHLTCRISGDLLNISLSWQPALERLKLKAHCLQLSGRDVYSLLIHQHDVDQLLANEADDFVRNCNMDSVVLCKALISRARVERFPPSIATSLVRKARSSGCLTGVPIVESSVVDETLKVLTLRADSGGLVTCCIESHQEKSLFET